MNKKHKKSKLRTLGIILWVSFVCASGATMFFFSMFDPEALGYITTWPITLDRIGGYSIGFLLFWVLTILSSSIAVLLVSNSHKKLEEDTFNEEYYDDSSYE